MTTIKQLIDKLTILADNLELGDQTPVLDVNYAFVQGGVQVHVTELNLHNVLYQSDTTKFVFVEPGAESGITLSYLPHEPEIKKDSASEVS